MNTRHTNRATTLESDRQFDNESTIIHSQDRCPSRMSTASGTSLKSGRTGSSRTKVLLAEAKMKQMAEMHEFETEIEEENHRLQKLMKENERKLALKKIQNETELARMEAACSGDEFSEPEEIKAGPTTVPTPRMKEYLEDCTQFKSEYRPVVNHAPLCQIDSVDNMNSRQYMTHDLPKVSLPSFDGNVKEYWPFMRQFDLYVAEKTKDPGQRLLYLMHYCVGEAKEAIAGCVLRPNSVAYKEARDILRNEFGQPYVIASTLLEELYKYPNADVDEPRSLTKLGRKMRSCMIALEEMEYLDDLNSLSTIKRIVWKLPQGIREKWSRTANDMEKECKKPRFRDLLELIEQEARHYNTEFGRMARKLPVRNESRPSTSYHKLMPKPTQSAHRNINATLVTKDITGQGICCKMCNQYHVLENCTDFLELNTTDKWDYLKKSGHCFNCLRWGHRVSECKDRKKCDIENCQKRHHNCLHNFNHKIVPPETPSLSCTSTKAAITEAIVGVIPVKVIGPKGEAIVYALLDNGSNVSLISNDLKTKLGISGQDMHLKVETLTDSTSIKTQRCDFSISHPNGSQQVIVEGAYSVESLPNNLVLHSPSKLAARWSHLREIEFGEEPNKRVCILIGCDVPEAHWVLEQRTGNRKQPYAVRTTLGWVLFGPTGTNTGETVVNVTLAGEAAIWDYLKTMYNQEFLDLAHNNASLSVEEQTALNIVKRDTKYDRGRYIVPLPWRTGTTCLPNNRAYALKRLLMLKGRFLRTEGLLAKYDEIIKSHVNKGYVEQVSEQGLVDPMTWYLPHHPVFHPKKPGKVRVVFDCAAKYRGESLNDKLYQGPDTTANLVGVLLRFRKHLVAVMADIEEMFLQVRVKDQDKNALRFLWWKDGDWSKDPICYRMLVHPFGATSSPFCANYALRLAIKDLGGNLASQISKIAVRDFYVDDCIASVANEEMAKQVVEGLTKTLLKGGFRLRKWVSNLPEVLAGLPADNLSTPIITLIEPGAHLERTLGVEWDVAADELLFRFSHDFGPNSRRAILRYVASVFDPLGLVSPIVMPAKMILQNVTRNGTGWDDEIKEEDLLKWSSWKRDIRQLDCVRLPRWVLRKGSRSTGTLQLHIFADASEKAYGSVAYVRQDTECGEACVNILIAKGRVAPLKTVTIPRLELSAAVLSVRLFQLIHREYEAEFEKVIFWTDSVLVLRYINNTTSKFSTFVANRVQEIQELSDPSQWHHTASRHNPADLISRGMRGTKEELTLWNLGPPFLRQKEDTWPEQKVMVDQVEGLELKRTKAFVNVVTCYPIEQLVERYSSWLRMLRATAWMIRYCDYLRLMHGTGVDRLRVSSLTYEEVKEAEVRLVRSVQKTSFKKEYEALSEPSCQTNQFNWNNSNIKKLSPILVNGLLRVGGRLELSNWSYDSKHPIILPQAHPVTRALILFHHEQEGHSGVAQVLAAIRRKYWILKGGSAVTNLLSKCLVCKRLNAVAVGQQMAELPLVRVEQGWHPFRYVGVDYFGPFQVKRGRILEKRYGCLFTCLQCRAVHIEISQTLSTDSFLLALFRFMNRRGAPQEMLSDNGKNFVGANRELLNWIRGLEQGKILDKLIERGVKWSFNPPLASHRGGIWERLIRSVRKVLYSVAGPRSMNEETLWTFFSYAERVINDRPLTVVRNSTNDQTPIRPSDLLHPRSAEFIAIDAPLKEIAQKRWRIVIEMSRMFWKRWKSEYLPALQQRQKWLWPQRQMKVGDVVNLVTESVSKGYWPLGVIQSVHPDGDGIIRTVEVKTNQGVVKRDIRKVCLLEGVG